MSEKHLTILQDRAKRRFLDAVEQLETLHQEPDDLAAQLSEGLTVHAQRYIKKFDKQTSRVLLAFFRYMAAMERRPR